MTETVPTRRTLTSILLEAGIVTSEQVDAALQRQLSTGRMIGETLVELGYTTEENIGWALSKQLGIPYVDIQSGAVDRELVRQFPDTLLRRIQATPLFQTQDDIVLAMSDPTDPEAVEDLKQAAGTQLSLVIGCPASIRRVLDSVFGPERVTAGEVPGRTAGTEEPRERRRSGDAGGPFEIPSAPRVVWDRSGATFLLYHVHTARGARASEIHFVPTAGGISVLYRTDQGLEERGIEQSETALYMRTRLAHLGVPDLEPGASASWGSARVELGGNALRLSVCHCRADVGVTTVLRLIPAPAEAHDLSTLGLSPIGEAEIRDFVEGPEGLVIVHGPPRSGGSTLLASLAALAARPHRRVVVFEPWTTAPYPPGTTRIHSGTGDSDSGPRDSDAGRRDSGGSSWERLAVGLGADVVVLDGILEGDAVDRLLGGAGVGRLIFARTDWLDGEKLLAFLARSRNGRALLRDRPFAMITLPNARREGSAVWTTPAESEYQAGLLEVRILTDEDRTRILAARTGS